MKKAQSSNVLPVREIENYGPGMFTSDHAQTSFDAAYLEVNKLLPDKAIASAFPDEILRNQLLEACRHYWADRAYDDRKNLVDIRGEISKLSDGLGLVLTALGSLSKPARRQIAYDIKRARVGEGGGFLLSLSSDLQRLKLVCAPLAQVQGTKKGGGRTCVRNCCRRLMNLRADLTGKPFAKTWTDKLDAGNAVEGFTGRDAQFVLKVMKAIDDGVTVSNVRSAGMSLTREASRKK